jgi:hypothetical protein
MRRSADGFQPSTTHRLDRPDPTLLAAVRTRDETSDEVRRHAANPRDRATHRSFFRLYEDLLN